MAHSFCGFLNINMGKITHYFQKPQNVWSQFRGMVELNCVELIVLNLIGRQVFDFNKFASIFGGWKFCVASSSC